MFPCQAPRGAPTPLVTWFRGGILVVEGPHRKIKVVMMMMMVMVAVVVVVVVVVDAI